MKSAFICCCSKILKIRLMLFPKSYGDFMNYLFNFVSIIISIRNRSRKVINGPVQGRRQGMIDHLANAGLAKLAALRAINDIARNGQTDRGFQRVLRLLDQRFKFWIEP